MKTLIEFIAKHAERGECKCGQCIDAGSKADPISHSADMVFFKVALVSSPTKEDFEKLVRENESGEFGNCNPLDGSEHNYIELGAWIGDQGLALMFMGLGHLLGSFDLLTPYTVLKLPEGDVMAKQLAGMGMVSIQTVKTPVTSVT